MVLILHAFDFRALRDSEADLDLMVIQENLEDPVVKDGKGKSDKQVEAAWTDTLGHLAPQVFQVLQDCQDQPLCLLDH